MQFEVRGMSCAHCAGAVRDAIRAIDSSAVVDVDLASGRVDIESMQSRTVLAEAIRSAGYETS